VAVSPDVGTVVLTGGRMPAGLLVERASGGGAAVLGCCLVTS
jgi:hypothetical protein